MEVQCPVNEMEYIQAPRPLPVNCQALAGFGGKAGVG